jgi:hypothetical protein
MVNRLRGSSPRAIEDFTRNSPDSEIEDDRLWRWYVANGITTIGYRTLSDGSAVMEYFRADGSKVNLEDSYGYDAPLTPYTDVQGSA